MKAILKAKKSPLVGGITLIGMIHRHTQTTHNNHCCYPQDMPCALAPMRVKSSFQGLNMQNYTEWVVVEPQDFAAAIRGDGPLPFMTGQGALAIEWEGEGGGPAALLSLLSAPRRAVPPVFETELQAA